MPILLFASQNCSFQNNDEKKNLINRKSAVAGKFYSSDANELKKTIADFFSKAVHGKNKNVLALIAPHAGYIFSGQVAASAFNQLDENKQYQNIFIVGSSHSASFSGASVYNIGNWETPLGTVEVNIDLATKLTNDCNLIHAYSDPHRFEHCLEVEVPFLQYKLKNKFKIIPILLGTQSNEDCIKLAKALRPYLNSDNLFVISTDMSHYPSYADALKVDSLTADAIISGSPEQLTTILYKNSKAKINNLSTSLCGWTSVLTLLYITSGKTDLLYTKIHYMNSGDVTLYGDKERVVGYVAIAVSSDKSEINPISAIKEEDFLLSEKDKKDLLYVARKTVEAFITKGKEPEIDTKDFSNTLKMSCGAFVTLHKKGQLRGCIGRFMTTDPLWYVVMQMAIASSTQDTRFTKVSIEELDKIDIEISVLTPLKRIKSINEFTLGKQGIYMIKNDRTGTFLPQVANETNWTKEEFLGHCARDKAGIGWDGWKDAELYTYEAIVLNEKG